MVRRPTVALPWRRSESAAGPLVRLTCVALLGVAAACSSDAGFSGGAPHDPGNAEVPPADPKTADQVVASPVPEAVETDHPAAATPTPAPVPTTGPTTAPTAAPTPQKQARTLERTFPLTRVEDLTVEVEPTYRRASQSLRLAEMPPATTTIKQVERAVKPLDFKQGHDGTRYGPEAYDIGATGLLDLVVIVDDSTSMADKKAGLSDKLDHLISSVGNTDWRIAVVTTSNPCFRGGKLLAKSDVNVAKTFHDLVDSIVLSDTVIEKGFPIAIKTLNGECNGVKTPWLRPDSAIGVLIVSDEENCGSDPGDGCPGEQGETADQMVSFLRSLRAVGQARIYGLIEAANECGTLARTGAIYLKGIQATGGTNGPVCAADFGPTLDAISANVAAIVHHTFKLGHVPDPGTLLLDVDGKALTTGFTLSADTVVVASVTPKDVTLHASYVSGATPKHDRFALAGAADPTTLVVKVDQTTLGASDFSVDATTGELVLAALPADDALVHVEGRANVPLPTKFTLSADGRGPPLGVSVGGVAVTDFTYDDATRTLTLKAAPRDGVDVAVMQRTKAGRITRYAAVTGGSAVYGVAARDATTGDPIAVALDGADLVFPIDDVTDGRMLVVTFDLGYDAHDLALDLPRDPLAGSVSVTATHTGTPCAGALDVTGRHVTFACGTADAGSFAVHYRAVTDRPRRFALDAAVPTAADAGVVWSVTTGTTDLTSLVHVEPAAAGAVGPTVVLPDLPDAALDATVVIRASWKQ